VIAVLIFFLPIALLTSENLTLGALGLFAMFISALYAFGLVFLFIFQQIHRFMKEKSRFKTREEIVKPKTSTVYE